MLLQLDFASDIPIYMQIRNQIVLGIAQGSLTPGERLPSIRTLSAEAGINMMTVSKAYQLLRQEGHIETDRRRGAVIVTPTAAGTLSPETQKALRLHIAEARLSGIDRETLLDFCRACYDDGRETSC